MVNATFSGCGPAKPARAARGRTGRQKGVACRPLQVTGAERVLTRRNHGFKDEAAARRMHDQLTRQPSADRHVVHQVDQSPDLLYAYVLDARNRGGLRYPAR